MNNCLVTTEEIKALAKEMQGETIESVKGLVALWQKEGNRSIEDYPTIAELNQFKSKIRSVDVVDMVDEVLSPSFNNIKPSPIEEQAKVNLDFNAQVRRDRVTLIARLFSNEVDKGLQEMSEALNKRIATADNQARPQLERDLRSLSRLDVIRKYTPEGLFNRVLQDTFLSYVNDTEENRILVELDKINAAKGADRYTDAQKLAAAKKRADYKTQAYRKVIDNFRPLASEASRLLVMTEGVRIDPSSAAPREIDTDSTSIEDDSEVDGTDADFKKEETPFKDGWMSNFREVSSHESLSQAVRKAIRQVPRLNYKGKYDKDDLGFPKYLDAEYVHATLIDKLKDMITVDDMIPLLEELIPTKPWVKKIIDLLGKDDALYSQFYQDFRKDFTAYWIQKKRMKPNGAFEMQTVSINKPEGVGYLLDSWRDNYESGTKLDDDSVYDTDGSIIKENAVKGLKWTETLNNKFVNLNTEARLELLENERIWNTILKLLNMIGIDANPSTLRTALTDIKASGTAKFTDPIMILIPQLNVIFSGIKKGGMNVEADTDGTKERKDLINTYSSVYNTIASMLADVTEDAIESSVRQNGKSHYSHVTPSYLGKLVKQFKNVRGDGKRFKEFIDNEYRRFEWFYKDGRWRSDWVQQLAESEEARKGFNHKVVLDSDKIEYSNWDSLDYTLVLLTEYWGDPDNSRSSTKWAWYHVPILSDSPSAEFLRFKKYVSGVEYDENGNTRSYDDIILDKLTDLVNQEYDRITLVIERDKRFQRGDNSVSPLANYDIKRKRDGSLDRLGGAEFKFLPALNSIKYDNGETFLDRLSRLSRESNGAELRDFIRGTLTDIMDEGFEEAYRNWSNVGLFTELPNGKYKYIPFDGQSQQNSRTTRSLIRAKSILGDLWTSNMESLLGAYSTNSPVDNRVAGELFAQINELLNQRAPKVNISKQEVDTISRELRLKNKAKDALREYYWNSALATSQIIELTTTDLAFYKDLKDFQKRFKEIHAPALRMNTKATFKGERVGRDVERTIYLKDDEIVSSVIDDIKEILDARVKKGEMTKSDRDSIISKYEEVNVADAQAYRSLSSYRAILGMSGQWTDDMERAYNNFMNGTWNAEDFNIIWQTKKPYVYTQISNISGIEGHTPIKTPVQHKNSEFLLLAMHNTIAGPLGKSGKLRAINKFMEDNQIDVVQFESTTKVGKQGVVDINDANSFDEVESILKKATIQEGIENPNVVHKVSYEDYGIQVQTPEHIIDTTQLVGTQGRKLITADIDPNAEIIISGRKISKDEWLNLYDSIIIENLLDSYDNVYEIFNDPKGVEEAILEEMRGNQRYSLDTIRASTLNENGEFYIPLYEPSQSQLVQTLLTSIIKNRITKQKIRGGALIQVSNYGLNNDLKIVYEGEGDNKRIKYFECYMPAYSAEFYRPLMKEGTHELDITKLPDSLRRLIGYRIPTEDKYSMAPLYIKGFLPQQNGSAIMLPSEITTIAGSDFDVDKLYVMLPEFKVNEFDYRRAKQDFKGEQRVMDELASLFKGGNLIEDLAKAPVKFKEWFEGNKEKYRLDTPEIYKVKYDMDRSPQEQSREARNNMLIDLMWGILTSPDTASKILNPGGFDGLKSAARITDILRSNTRSELKKLLGTGSIIDKLLSMDLDELNELAERTEKPLNPLSPVTQVYFHQQNMTGAKLIGIYANHNANHALMQHTDLSLSENGAFTLNGKRLSSLHNMKNSDGEFISKNNAQFSAASVDNVKDPVLASLNQNAFTADMAALLSRLGFKPIEIGLFMTQPIVTDIIHLYLRESREGKSKDSIIDDVLTEYRRKGRITKALTYDNLVNNQFLISELADNILDANNLNENNAVPYYKGQVAVGTLFKRIMKDSDSLKSLVQATRSDTQGGAAGPTIADIKIKIQRLQDFLRDSREDESFPLANADVLSDDIPLDLSKDQMRQRLLDSKLPFLQAFYTLGLAESERMLGSYFPQFTESFDSVINILRGMTKTGRLDAKTMNSIYNDLMAYIMSNTSFFSAEGTLSVSESGVSTGTINSEDKRRDFIYNFPSYFKDLLAKNEDIADLEFIKRLRVVRSEDAGTDIVVFKNVGRLTPILKERFMNDWASLLYMSNPEAHNLALKLFRYSYYRNGFAFGPNTFIHLAPVAVKVAIPEYIETLRGLLTAEDNYDDFVGQYIYNHLDNRKFVPEIPSDTSTSFIDENSNILNEVTFVITPNSKSGDRKIIRKKTEANGGPKYDFFKFIARRTKKGFVYYRLDGRAEANSATYVRIEPLGVKNTFIEYEYGKEAQDIQSVFNKGKEAEPSVDSTNESAAFETAQLTDEDTSSSDTSSRLSDEEILSEAFKTVYKTEFKTEATVEEDILSLKPNTEYKDENGDIICGSESLGFI